MAQLRRVAAIVLSFIGPLGIGHFVLGRRVRGIVWLAAPMAFLLAFGFVFPSLGARIGWSKAVSIVTFAMLLAWTASFVDLLRFDDEAEATPLWQIIAFGVVGFATPLAISVVIRAEVLDSFVIPTSSMEPTVLVGDRIFADKREHTLRYGEVIVFASPEHPEQLLVKRVIALPGDSLEVRSGHPVIDGWEVPSCALGTVTLDGSTGALELEFLGDASYLVFYDSSPTPIHAGPLYAAKDGVLVLGDNRNNSADSRSWFGGRDGNVHASALHGSALFVWARTSREDDARFGIDLSTPELPSSLGAVRPQLATCLASRPSVTTPSARATASGR
jgi:signal peptidase I